MSLCQVLIVAVTFSAFSLSESPADELSHKFSDDECQKMLAGMDAWFDKFETDKKSAYEALDRINDLVETSSEQDTENAEFLSALRGFVEQVITPPTLAATNGDLTIRNKCSPND